VSYTRKPVHTTVYVTTDLLPEFASKTTLHSGYSTLEPLNYSRTHLQVQGKTTNINVAWFQAQTSLGCMVKPRRHAQMSLTYRQFETTCTNVARVQRHVKSAGTNVARVKEQVKN